MKKRGKKRRPSASDVRSLEEYYRLPFSEQLRREKSFRALSLMRGKGLSRTQAAREVGISPSSMQQIVGKALTKQGGRYKAKNSDRYLRFYVLPVPGGKTEVSTRSTRVGRLISGYDNALRRYTHTGDYSGVAEFENVSFWANGRRYEFLTDRRQLDKLQRAGALSFESIYARTI